MRITNTPYDDVFRTLLNDCSALILPVINEVFGESYTGDEEIVFAPNEHFLNREDGQEQERITDASFKIIGTETKKYHWECQGRSEICHGQTGNDGQRQIRKTDFRMIS